MSIYHRTRHHTLFMPVCDPPESFTIEGPAHPRLLFSPLTVADAQGIAQSYQDKADGEAMRRRIIGASLKQKLGSWDLAYSPFAASPSAPLPEDPEARGKWLEEVFFAEDQGLLIDFLTSLLTPRGREGNSSAK